MFLGTYHHKLDQKNRLNLPTKIVSKLSADVVVSKGFDGCLELRTATDFETYSNHLMTYSANKRESRILVRQLLANAIDLKIDKTNRILIPQNLLVESQIKDEVVIIGVGNKLEIWNKQAYEAFKIQTDSIYQDIAQGIDDEKDF